MKKPDSQGLRPGSVLIAASLACSSLAHADLPTDSRTGLTGLMPHVFSRIEYVANAPQLEALVASASHTTANQLQQFHFIQPIGDQNLQARQRNKQATQKPAQTAHQTRQGLTEQEYANQDLDLALENFFYALEDLIQSASRNAEINSPRQDDTYIAQVQFPVNVMTSLSTATPAPVQPLPTQGTSAQNATVVAQTTLPPTRTSVHGVKPSLFGFLDSFKLESSISQNIEFNDNIYTTRENTESDLISRTAVKSVLESRTRKSALKFEGDLNAGVYKERSADNYIDYSTTGSYSTLLSQRSKAFFGLGYFKHHEDRGEGSTDGSAGTSLAEPVEFESIVARGIYERGTKRTRARLVADAKIDQLRTSNFRDVTAIRNRDRDISAIIGTAFYNWSQRMSFLVELRHQDIEYVSSSTTDSLDSTQTRYAFGAEWLATRKTAGSVRVGLQEKNFANRVESDQSNVSWEAVVEWTPRPRTEVIFETLSDTEESDGFGTARNRTDYKVTWKQKWTPRISSSTSLQTGQTEYQEEQREDELSLINAQLQYSINSSANASIKLTYLDNSSNVTEFNFDRSTIQVGLDMEL